MGGSATVVCGQKLSPGPRERSLRAKQHSKLLYKTQFPDELEKEDTSVRRKWKPSLASILK